MSNKISFRPNLRKGIIATLVLLLLASTGMAVRWFLPPAQSNQEVPVYAARQAAAIAYLVYYTPNNYFAVESAGPGLAYITPLTDYINSSFTYQFAGESQAEISGEYKVKAVLTGYLTREKTGSGGEKRELVKLYEKEDILIPATPFQAVDSKLTLNNQAVVNIRNYADFINAVSQDLRISADVVRLDIAFQVSSRVSTAQGEVIQELAPVMSIPMEGRTFTVEGKLKEQTETPITIMQMTAVPGVKTKRAEYAAASVIFLILLLGMMFKTTAEIKDPLEQELSRIMKKYGDWIAAGQGAIPAAVAEKTLEMQSIADLIKVADEVGQPVLYENTGEGAHSFYVISEGLVYKYILQNPV